MDERTKREELRHYLYRELLRKPRNFWRTRVFDTMTLTHIIRELHSGTARSCSPPSTGAPVPQILHRRTAIADFSLPPTSFAGGRTVVQETQRCWKAANPAPLRRSSEPRQKLEIPTYEFLHSSKTAFGYANPIAVDSIDADLIDAVAPRAFRQHAATLLGLRPVLGA